MKSIREQFEEIWPVPEGVYWDSEEGEYMPREWRGVDEYMELSVEWDARLDTFTRCQETTSIHLGLINELVDELESFTKTIYAPSADEVIDRAKQITRRKE